MAAVEVIVNERGYKIACNDGEEKQLLQLAARVEAKVQEVVAMVGQIGEQRLLLMAAMLLAEDLSDAADQQAANAKTIAELQAANELLLSQTGDAEGLAADKLEAAAGRVEAVLEKLTAK